MHNYKITVMYDGSRYKGWQSQKSTDDTIEGKIEGVLKKLTGREVAVIGSGRTDAGVHAMGQVANFHIKDSCSKEEIMDNLNQYLPEDITVTAIEKVDERFHSRFSCTRKVYRYRIHTSTIKDVFQRKYVYNYTEGLDVDKMKQAAKKLEGTHDFTSFCGNKHFKKTPERTVFGIVITQLEHEIQIDYYGEGFLQNMVRIMTGTLIEVGQGKKTPEDMETILEAKDRAKAGYTAPPQGLCLLRVEYESGSIK